MVLCLSLLGFKTTAAKVFDRCMGNELGVMKAGDLLAGNGMTGGAGGAHG